MSMTENAANIALANQSLGLLGSEAIVLNGTSVNHEHCTLFFDDSRDEMLVNHPWNWANKVAYAIQTTDPITGDYDNAFTIPTDCLRVLTIENDPLAKYKRRVSTIVTDEGNVPSDWVTATDYLVGQYVTNDDVSYICIVAHTSGDTDDEPGTGATEATYWTSQTTNLKILEVEYIYQVTDVLTYPSYMRMCLVMNLAIRLSSPILQAAASNMLLNFQTSLFGGPKTWGYLNIAKAIDAQEAGGETIKTNKFLSSRRYYVYVVSFLLRTNRTR